MPIERKGGGKRVEQGREWRQEQRERAGRGGTRKVMVIVEAGTSGEGNGGIGKIGDPSVGNMQTYRTAYEWEGAD